MEKEEIMISDLLGTKLKGVVIQYFAQSSVACIIVNTAGEIVECNEGFMKLLRLSEIPAGKDFEYFLVSSNKNLNWKNVNKANLIFRSVDSLPVLADCLIFPYSEGWVIFGENITLKEEEIAGKMNILINEMADLNREVIRQKKELTRMDMQKSAFVANVSHEFKNPLTAIKESLSLIIDGLLGDVNARQREFLSAAKKSAERLTRLVNDILDISKIEAGKMEMRIESFDITTLVSETLVNFKLEMAKKNISIKKNIQKDVGEIRADRDKISEVLINLLSNAIKYTPDGGEVGIKIIGKENEVYFEISDTGPGIPEEYKDKIFDKFERITTEKIEGTGLGLPIAKDIVELHKGRIWVESEPGKGSRFIFMLPKTRGLI